MNNPNFHTSHIEQYNFVIGEKTFFLFGELCLKVAPLNFESNKSTVFLNPGNDINLFFVIQELNN